MAGGLGPPLALPRSIAWPSPPTFSLSFPLFFSFFFLPSFFSFLPLYFFFLLPPLYGGGIAGRIPPDAFLAPIEAVALGPGPTRQHARRRAQTNAEPNRLLLQRRATRWPSFSPSHTPRAVGLPRPTPSRRMVTGGATGRSLSPLSPFPLSPLFLSSSLTFPVSFFIYSLFPGFIRTHSRRSLGHHRPFLSRAAYIGRNQCARLAAPRQLRLQLPSWPCAAAGPWSLRLATGPFPLGDQSDEGLMAH